MASSVRGVTRVPRYRLYGLTVECPLALPYAATSTEERADVRLRPATAGQFAQVRRRLERHRGWRSWFFSRRLPTGEIYARWTGLLEFLISQDGRTIWYRQLKHATTESFGVYLVGQILSFSMLAFGDEPLHGAVVSIGGQAVAFVGNCGYGKSTLAAAMLARGHPIVTDDVIALDGGSGGWTVHPGVPRVKLFPAVAKALLGVRGGEPMNRHTTKRVLPLGRHESVRRKLPLAAIYVLDDPAERGRFARPAVEPLSPSEAFLEIVRAAFNLLVLERERLAIQFDFARRVAAGVRVRRLRYRRTLSALPDVCEAVLEDLAGSLAGS